MGVWKEQGKWEMNPGHEYIRENNCLVVIKPIFHQICELFSS